MPLIRYGKEAWRTTCVGEWHATFDPDNLERRLYVGPSRDDAQAVLAWVKKRRESPT